MSVSGFDEAYYLEEKLAALQSTDSSWQGKSVNDLRQLFTSVGMSAESHYQQYGWQEGLSPNAMFDADEYAVNKGGQLVEAGVYSNLSQAVSAFTSAWSGNLYEHYLQFGAAEGIDPSDSFSTDTYLSAKLASLQAVDSTFSSWSVETLADAFASAGLTPLSHYLLYGRAEGISCSSTDAADSTPGIMDTTVETSQTASDNSANTSDSSVADSRDSTLSGNGAEASSAQQTTLADGDYSVSELTGTAALPSHFTLTDSYSVLSTHQSLVEQADSYTLTDSTGTNFGQVSNEMLQLIENSSNYDHKTWAADTEPTEVGNDSDAGPYDGVAYILVTFPDGSMYRGSGVIVGQNDVLTASHVIYSVSHGGVASSVSVLAGYDGETSPWNQGEAVTNINYYEVDTDGDGMLAQSESGDDIALLTVGGGISGTVFELAENEGSGFYNMTGYPAGYENAAGNSQMINDYGEAEASSWADILNFEETLQPEGGSSGGPLWYKDGDSYKVAGVVSTSGWACDVSGHYDELTQWMAANDSAQTTSVELTGVAAELTVDVAA